MALVSTDWVAEHLHDPNVRLIEVDVDTAAYERGHIDIYGHPNAALMNGGRKKWELETRPLTTDVAAVQPSSYHASEPNFGLRAYLSDVLGRSAATDLVDVRSPAEFNGEIIAPPGLSETAQRGGHIPGAQSIPWAQAASDDGTFKSADDLSRLYGDKGVTAASPVIAYCRIGERSSHTWFVLRELLGYPDVRNYDGSWTEYGSTIGVPIDNPAMKARELASV
jgi:thiosulfate/3-mercaptopyruvate sulfurtransferase